MCLKAIEHYQYRRSASKTFIDLLQINLKNNPHQKTTLDKLQEEKENFNAFNKYVNDAVNIYIDKLRQLKRDSGDKDIKTALASLKNGFSSQKTSYSKDMIRLLSVVEKHTTALSKGSPLMQGGILNDLARIGKAKGKK